jgi:hypothetical protein
MFASEDDTDAMDAPCPCVQCGNWFDLHDGYGSDKWHPGIVICATCHREEETELERDEEIEELTTEIAEAEFTIREARKRLEKLGVKPGQ